MKVKYKNQDFLFDPSNYQKFTKVESPKFEKNLQELLILLV